jgi:hypothetical protein
LPGSREVVTLPAWPPATAGGALTEPSQRMKTGNPNSAAAITALVFGILICVHAAAATSAAFDPVRLRLSNDLHEIRTTNDGSRTVLKTMRVLSNALVIASSDASDSFVLSRLARVLPAFRFPQYNGVLMEAGELLREHFLAEWRDLAASSEFLPPALASGSAERFALLARSQFGQLYGPVGQRLRTGTNAMQISAALIAAQRLLSRGQVSLNRFFRELGSGEDDTFRADFQIAKIKFSYSGSAQASFDGTNVSVHLAANSTSPPARGLLGFAFSIDAQIQPGAGVPQGTFVAPFPAEGSRAVTLFTTNGVNFVGGSAAAGGIWIFVTATDIVGSFHGDGDSWHVTHGRFKVPLLHASQH